MYVCNYNQGQGRNASEDTGEEVKPHVLPLRVSRVPDQEETSPMAPFTCPAACSRVLLHWERGGDTLLSCPNNFGTSPLPLEKPFPCLVWRPQLPASPGKCPLYHCLQPGSTARENSNSHHSDPAGPRREVLIAKSSLTTEASLPREHIIITHSP